MGRARILAFGMMAAIVSLLFGLSAAKTAHAATTFFVNSTADGGDNNTADNKCYTGNIISFEGSGGQLVLREECTLRAAIQQANATAGTDEINFSMPTNASGYNSTTGVWTITPASGLPEITGPVTINGYSQAGASPNTNGPDQGTNAVLKIELNGTNSGTTNPDGSPGIGAPVLRISGGGSTVKGLVINRPRSSAIWLTGPSNNVIEGNFIGTNPPGTQGLGCASGVELCTGLVVNTTGAGTGNTIGGTAPAARNIISGNDSAFGGGYSDLDGVVIESSGNLVQGNLIGTNAAGTGPLGNRYGVLVNGGSGNTIGGTTPAARNVVSSNARGIQIGAGSSSGTTDVGDPHDNLVQGNFIGTDVTGAPSPDPMQPIFANIEAVRIVAGASSNIVGGTVTGAGNLISGNAGRSVLINGGTDNSVLSNSIHSNDGLGIDLGPTGITANDPFDTDTGANDLQNFPLLDSAVSSGSTITVSGTLNSEADTTYNVQFFSSPTADPSGNGEGQSYLGQKNVTTNPSGDASFTFTPSSAPAGSRVVAATATSPGGDTSEFSNAVAVSAPANDHFADAQSISGNTISVGGTTALATRETGEPDHLTGNASLGEHSVWYRWTAPAAGSVAVDTCTANTDTVLAVYTGDSFANLSRVADNNDACASGSGSKVTFDARAGTNYRIAVAGLGSNSEGTFTLELVLPDMAAPDTSIVSGPSGPTSDNTPTFTFSGSDDLSTQADLLFSRKVVPSGVDPDSVAWSGYSAKTSVTLGGTTGLAQGSYAFYVRARDQAGNEDGSPAQRSFTIDTAKPTIRGTSPRHRSTIEDTTPIVKATVKDNNALRKANIKLYVNGVRISATKYTYTASTGALVYKSPTLAPGKKTVKIVATDAAKNVGQKSWYFTIG